jgi:hypothetical protein
MAGYGTRNWKWPVWVCFGAEGKGKLLAGEKGKQNRREKAGIGEKGVLVLWSGVCGVSG